MKYSENLSGIQLNVEGPHVDLSDQVKDSIRKSLDRLGRHYSQVCRADVFLKDKEGKSTNRKEVSIRLSIPGNDAYASETGDNFMALLSQVEEKLRRQLEKGKRK